jgi:predicted esterase YcpF (UPF0227 family)
MNILYIHGFRSSGTGSYKSEIIQKVFPEANIITPDLSHDLREDLCTLSNILDKGSIDLIIGTSMGGFIADYLAIQFDKPSILVNPLADIQHLINKTGQSWTNYKTGKEFFFSKDNELQINLMDWVICNSSRKETALLVLGTNDEVLDYTDAVFKYKNFKNVQSIYMEDDHRFNKCLEQVLEIWKKIINK